MRNVQPLTLALDWNGTVVDDAARAHEALRAVLGPGGLAPPDLDAFRQGFRMPLRRWFTGEYDLDEARRAEVTAIAFARDYRPRQCLRAREPAAIVDDLSELIPLVEAGPAVEGGDAGRESAVPGGSHGH